MCENEWRWGHSQRRPWSRFFIFLYFIWEKKCSKVADLGLPPHRILVACSFSETFTKSYVVKLPFPILCHQLLLSGETQYQSTLSSYLVSSWSKSLSISGGDSSCSWVLVRALGLIVKEEFKSVMLGGGWRCGELQYLRSNSKNLQVSASAEAPALEEYKYSASVQSLLLLLGLVMISEHRINS